MSKNMMRWTLGLLAVGCMLAMAPPAGAEFVMMDSADFTWKYEMDAKPSDTDLDSVGGGDFNEVLQSGCPAPTVSGGILTIDSSGSAGYVCAYQNIDSDQTWQLDSNISYANGYTFEMRVRVDSNRPRGFSFRGGPGNGVFAWLEIRSGGQAWGNDTSTDLGSATNSDVFHVFRVAQKPGEDLFSVWRDGLPLSDTLVTASPWGDDRLGFADGGESWGGVMEVDYLRFTAGAYAPIPEPGTMAILATGLIGLLCYAWRKQK